MTKQKWFVFSKITDCSLEQPLTSSIELFDNIRIDFLSNNSEVQDFNKTLDPEKRIYFNSNTLCICSDFEIEENEPLSFSISENNPIFNKYSNSINIVKTAMWIVKPTCFTTENIFFINCDATSQLRSITSTSEKLFVYEEQRHERLGVDDIKKAAIFSEKILALARKGAVWTAIRILHKSLPEKMWEIRYLLQCMVLESLFGPSDAREISYRMSQRIAFFLFGKDSIAVDEFRRIKEMYDWRSKIVHGMKLEKLSIDKSKELIQYLENILRLTLLKIIEKNYAEKFDSRSRCVLLDKLPFMSDEEAFVL